MITYMAMHQPCVSVGLRQTKPSTLHNVCNSRPYTRRITIVYVSVTDTSRVVVITKRKTQRRSEIELDEAKVPNDVSAFAMRRSDPSTFNNS